jgi:hypothetical protein
MMPEKELQLTQTPTSPLPTKIVAPIIAPISQSFTPPKNIQPIATLEGEQQSEVESVVMCWMCKSPVSEDILGCPSCGARYHSGAIDGCDISQLEHCISCQAPASDFINA